jgi:hypothetical protein
MARYYLFFDGEMLVRVTGVKAYSFANKHKAWVRADSFVWIVTGAGGDSDFKDMTRDEAKKLFPAAFDS